MIRIPFLIYAKKINSDKEVYGQVIGKGGTVMSLSMLKMWISIAGMGLLAIAMVVIYFSRYKIKVKFFKYLTAMIAYICLFVGGLIMVYVVMS